MSAWFCMEARCRAVAGEVARVALMSLGLCFIASATASIDRCFTASNKIGSEPSQLPSVVASGAMSVSCEWWVSGCLDRDSEK